MVKEAFFILHLFHRAERLLISTIVENFGIARLICTDFKKL